MLSKVFCSYKFHCPRQLGRDGCFVERVSSESKDPCGQPHVWYQGIYRELTLKMQISGRLSSQSGMFLIGKICWFVLDDVLKTYLPHFSSTLKGIHDFGGGGGGGSFMCWDPVGMGLKYLIFPYRNKIRVLGMRSFLPTVKKCRKSNIKRKKNLVFKGIGLIKDFILSFMCVLQ